MSGEEGVRRVTSEVDELNQWAAPVGPDALPARSRGNGACAHGARTVAMAVSVAGPERVLMP